MKVVVVSVVRNEADVIEAFVRHHATFADEIVVVDHMSCDATAEILGELAAEGLPLVLKAYAGVAFNQGNIVSAVVREVARERGADWIVPLDADEFLTSDADPHVRPVLEALDQSAVFRVPWRTYVPHATDKPDEPHLHQRIQHRRVDEGLVHAKVIVPGALVRARRVTISHGNHRVMVRRRFRDRRVKAERAEHLVLAHFPVRSVAQVTARALIGWPVRLARGASPKKHWGTHWLFERVRNGEVIRNEDLAELGAYYAQPLTEEARNAPVELLRDPVVAPGSYTLSRPGQLSAPPQVIAARLLEQFAMELSQRKPR